MIQQGQQQSKKGVEDELAPRCWQYGRTSDVSDSMLMSSYEETLRVCKIENTILQDISAFGTLGYELDRAAERLTCITTILRNFPSFSPIMHL